jgi:hypothetical protein
MSNLMDTYNNMMKAAHEEEESAVLDQEAENLVKERVGVIAKYAEAANTLLTEEYGADFAEDDVVKLASYLIDKDVEEEENQEKVAEYIEAGQIMAKSFVDEIKASNSSDNE